MKKRSVFLCYKICILLFVFFTAVTLSAQSPADGENARNTFFAEYLSTGTFFSVNYDRVFWNGSSFSASYRFGVSAAKNSIGLPVGISFFNGRGNSHAEFGLVVIPFVEDYKYLFSAGNRSDKKLYIVPGAGYRFQKPGGGFFFKSILAPVIFLDPRSDNFWKMDGKLLPGITVAAGYSF
ncbi:MAG: hypothetical protein ABL872_06725 [Lacibacter sp.]